MQSTSHLALVSKYKTGLRSCPLTKNNIVSLVMFAMYVVHWLATVVIRAEFRKDNFINRNVQF